MPRARRHQAALIVGCMAVLMLALCLRTAFTLSSADWVEFTHPQNGMDVDLLWQSAIELNTIPADQPRFALMQASAPGFTFLLAGTQKLLGVSLYKHRLLMGLVGTLTVLMLMVAAWSWQRNTGITIATGLLAATCPATVYFDTQVIKVSAELLLIAILVAWMLRLQCNSLLQAVLNSVGLSGVLLGLIASQFAAILFPAAIAFWIAIHSSVSRKWRTCMIALVLVLTTAGSGLLQHPEHWMPDRYGAFLPVDAIHANVGFHHEATGTYHSLPDIPGAPFGHTFTARILAETERGHALTAREANTFWHERVMAFIQQFPAEAGVIALKKCRLFFASHETKANEYFPDIQAKSTLLQWLPWRWGILLAFAVAGFLHQLRSDDRHAWPLATLFACVLAANLLTFVTWRYRLHAIVPLFLFAGIGLYGTINTLYHWLKTRQQNAHPADHGLLLARTDIAVGLLVLVLSLQSLPEQLVQGMAGKSAHNNRSNLILLEKETQLATLQDKRDIDTQIQQATLLNTLHRDTESYRLLEQIIRSSTESPEANALWLTYLAWLGDTEKTRDFIQHLLTENPPVLANTWKQLSPLIQKRCQALGLVPARKTAT